MTLSNELLQVLIYVAIIGVIFAAATFAEMRAIKKMSHKMYPPDPNKPVSAKKQFKIVRMTDEKAARIEEDKKAKQGWQL